MEYYHGIAMGVGAYYLISLFFCLFPRIIHGQRRHSFYARHISHRGGSGEEIENTLEAFRNALKQAGRLKERDAMLELDVHLTKDKKVVVAHDRNLERICGVNKLVSEYNYQDLPPMLNELDVSFFPGARAENTSGSKRRIPTLEQVFEEFPEVPINLDVKDNDDELINKTELLIRKYGRETITVWGNDKDEVETKLYKKNPRIPLLFSSKRVYRSFLYFFLGILPFMHMKETHFEVLLPYRVNRGTDCRSVVGNFAWNFFAFVVLNRLYIHHLKQRGIQIYYWVLNTEEEFNKAERYGADGIMTDFPAKLTPWLLAKRNRLR